MLFRRIPGLPFITGLALALAVPFSAWAQRVDVWDTKNEIRVETAAVISFSNKAQHDVKDPLL